MIYITTTISKDKLKLKDYESDSMVRSNSKSANQLSEKEFYAPAVTLLALIYSALKDSRNN